MAELSTSELVTAAATGDQDAWNRLVDGHSKLVWAVVRNHRLRTGDAEDAFQTTWLRLVEHLGRLDRPDRLASWLVTTARRECLRMVRRHQRELPDEHLEQRVDGATTSSDPAEAAMLREEHSTVLRAFRRLSERCQAVLRLTVATPDPDGYREVSAALGMAVGSLGPTRMRCLDQLRRLYGEAHQP